MEKEHPLYANVDLESEIVLGKTKLNLKPDLLSKVLKFFIGDLVNKT